MHDGPQIKKQLEVANIHDNTAQELIEITSDKLQLILSEHLQTVDARKSWHTPLSLFIGIILVFCTAEFKNAFGLHADTWAALFLLAGGLSLLWLLRELLGIRKVKTIPELLDLIKNK